MCSSAAPCVGQFCSCSTSYPPFPPLQVFFNGAPAGVSKEDVEDVFSTYGKVRAAQQHPPSQLLAGSRLCHPVCSTYGRVGAGTPSCAGGTR